MSGQMLSISDQFPSISDFRVEKAHVAIVYRDAGGQVGALGAILAEHNWLCGKDCRQGPSVSPIAVGHFLTVLAARRQHRDHRRSGVQRQLVQQRY